MSTHERGADGARPGARLRQMLVDSPTSAGARARARRWNVVTGHFPELADMRVLDLGGTVETWQRAPVRPAHVTVVNLFEPGQSADEWITPIVGDACSASTAVADCDGPARFDLVFSNSLIEHVGGHAKRAELAAQVRSLAPYHWVQTPYRYFPVEPHWLFPLMQFMPVPAKLRVATAWPLVHSRPPSREAALNEILWTELVSLTEMRMYFPESQIVNERFAGLTKSISAVRSPSAAW